ncbi:lipopolysaccharide biosynthesis protein [Aequorivita sp. H23M31]|uniref:Lipopolysaccharide biosynthesis protein n=1 Tax=Aequorivita ciconiae TaxID=2494375 RepID=A0A410G201_9FLAO|nr:lipopolysaccharide biosynthesis protein [Aequorivita sp. H23M31]QAA81308.1 lipopolysaccharide biosynthesis protein [Aequorivita sp. H23M31]
MSIREKSILGIFWVFTQQFSNQAINFVVSIFLARILMPADFGLIGMITVFMALSQVLLNSGLTQSIIRQTNPTQIDYSTVFFFNMGASVILYITLFFSAGFVANFYSQPELVSIIRVYTLTLIINACGAVQFTRLTKQMDFKTQMMVTVPSLVISGLAGVTMAYMGFGVWALVYMSLLQTVLRTIQIWIKSKWMPSLEFNVERFKYHIGFSYKLGISGVLYTLYSNIYQIVIGKFFAPAQVGFYTRAASMRDLPVSNISNALSKVTYPLFAEIKDDNPRLKRVYKMMMQSIIFVLCPVMIYLIVVAEPLFRLLFTEKWLPAVPYFQILCISGILYPLHSYNLNILNVKGRSDLFLKLESIKIFLGVIVIIISIRYGIIALLWGQLLSSILALVINSYYSGNFINYKLFDQLNDIAPTLFLASIIGVAAWFLDSCLFVNFNDILRILVLALMGLLLYIVGSHLFKFEAYINIISLIKNRR